MGSANKYTLFAIDEYSITPKYLQLTNSILKGIEAGKIDKDDLLPSINDLSYEPEISRDTGERAYKHLKKMSIVSSKKIIQNGITTISTEFQRMGKRAAELILGKSTEQLAIPFYLTLRDSL
jgi:DNA-binding transcriptional regulator YhcF (GntR family)